MDTKQDVRIVNAYFKFGKLLGATPMCRKKDTTISYLAYNLYVLVLLILVIFGSIFSIISRYNGFWNQNTISQVILECVEVFSELLFMICTFLGALRYGHNWVQIFSNLDIVDKELDTEKLASNCQVYQYILKIVFLHMGYLFIHTYELVMWAQNTPQAEEYGYILYRIIMYYQFYMTLFAVNIIDVLRSRFLALQNILEEASSRRNIMISQTDNSYISVSMTKLRRLYGLLYNVQQNVNLIFRNSIFFLIIANILTVLADLNSIVQFAHTSDEEFNIGVSFINFLYSVIYSSASVSIVMSCNGLEIIGQKMVTTCYLHRNIFEKTTVSNELISFAEYTKNLIPTFSAAGFFQVNQQLLSTLFAAVITYFIIIIQFNLKF